MQEQEKPNIGVLASDDSKGRLRQFLEDYQTELKDFRIFATGGTFNYLKKHLTDSKAFDLHPLRPGPAGGVVQLAGMVVDGECEVVIFLTDQNDNRFTSTENGALLRVCNVHGVKIFLNEEDARLWADNELQTDLKNLRKWTFSDLKPRPKACDLAEPPRSIQEQTLALIAHDNKKEEMFEFAIEHKEKLRKIFHEPDLARPARIIATGHTGIGVQKVTGGDLRIERLKSGPLGGDVEIANRVLAGTCHHVLFFMDPLTPHPHYEDIRLLMNICSLPDVKVTLRTSKRSAGDWIEHV